MNKTDILIILKKLAQGFLDNKIEGNLYQWITESLIMTNLDLVPELEDFADFLAQYKHNSDMSELYGDKELKQKIKKIFKWK